jgi:hypothetical protein
VTAEVMVKDAQPNLAGFLIYADGANARCFRQSSGGLREGRVVAEVRPLFVAYSGS